MDTVFKLEEISLRLDHVESSGQWLSQILAGSDVTLSEAANLISTLADDIRGRLLDLITELEKQLETTSRLH